MADEKTVTIRCSATIKRNGRMIPAGNPVELPEKEALSLIERHGGSIVRDDDGDGLEKHNVAALKELAEKEKIDLGDATRKDDIIAAIRLARGE